MLFALATLAVAGVVWQPFDSLALAQGKPGGSLPLAQGKVEPPKLTFAFEVRATVGPPLEVGSVAQGRRRIVPITGGTFEGSGLRGKVMPGGADWQIIRADGVTELTAVYELKADDGTLIHVINRGLRHGPAEVMQRLARGEPVDPGSYYFRTVPVFEAPAGAHDWLNRSIFVASGVRRASDVQIRVFEVR